MILDAAVLALTGGSLLACATAVAAAGLGTHILAHWDLSSGSDLQLRLERRTYLISTLLSYVMITQIVSLFLFVYTADRIHGLFVGVMCAAGSLNVNGFGYPALLLKLMNSILCGLWLILNRTDQTSPDYPLLVPKYRLLRWIAGSLTLEALLQTSYFLNLRPHLITSCCGALFGSDAQSLGGDLAGVPPEQAKVIFFVGLALLVRAGIQVILKGSGARVFSLVSGFLLVWSLVSVVSYISVYYYELPTHHCPFCLLQAEYHHIGYVLYVPLLTGGICGLGVGLLDRYRGLASLSERLPAIERKLALVSLTGYLLFAAVSSYPMVFSDFRLNS